MTTEIRIILMPVGVSDRKDAEYLENMVFKKGELGKAMHHQWAVFELTDFMDVCNNQEMNLDNYWVTYVHVEVGEGVEA